MSDFKNRYPFLHSWKRNSKLTIILPSIGERIAICSWRTKKLLQNSLIEEENSSSSATPSNPCPSLGLLQIPLLRTWVVLSFNNVSMRDGASSHCSWSRPSSLRIKEASLEERDSENSQIWFILCKRGKGTPASWLRGSWIRHTWPKTGKLPSAWIQLHELRTNQLLTDQRCYFWQV